MEMPKNLESGHEKTMLEEFQDEIQRLKDAEEKEGKSIHLKNVDPKELTEEDFQMYAKLKAIKELKKISEDVKYGMERDNINFAQKLNGTNNQSRIKFFEYIRQFVF